MSTQQNTKTIGILLLLIFWCLLAVSASAREGVGISSWLRMEPEAGFAGGLSGAAQCTACSGMEQAGTPAGAI